MNTNTKVSIGLLVFAVVLVAGLIYGPKLTNKSAPTEPPPIDQNSPLPLVENTFFWKDYSEKAFDELKKAGIAKDGVFSSDKISPQDEQDWTGDGVSEGFFATKTANQYAVLRQTEEGVGLTYAYPTFESKEGIPFIVKKDSYKHNPETSTLDVALGEGLDCNVFVYKWEQVKKGFVLQDGAIGDTSLCK